MTSKIVMPKGKESNVRENKKTGRWDYNVRLVRPDGSLFRRAGSAPKEADARRKRDSAYAEFNRDEGRTRDNRRCAAKEKTNSIRAWTEYVHDEVWPHSIALTSRDAYMYCLGKHVLPVVGDVALTELTTQRLQELVNQLWNDNKKGPARQVRSSVSNLYSVAIRQGKATMNPAAGVAIQDSRRRTVRDEVTEELRRILSEDEVNRLLEAARAGDMYLPILFGVKCGLRVAEALGLEWKHVDLDEQVVRVRQQLQWVRGRGNIMVPPKSKASRRTVPLPPSLIDELRAARSKAKSSYVCTRGTELFPSKKHHVHFDKVVEAAHLSEPHPTFHNLRGTYLTYMANVKGVKPSVLMALAGHSSIEVTMRYYVRALDDDLRKAVEDL
jgi:integrase